MYFENLILFASADAKFRTSILNTMFYKLYVFRKKLICLQLLIHNILFIFGFFDIRQRNLPSVFDEESLWNNSSAPSVFSSQAID